MKRIGGQVWVGITAVLFLAVSVAWGGQKPAPGSSPQAGKPASPEASGAGGASPTGPSSSTSAQVVRAAGPWNRVKDWVGCFIRQVKPEAELDLNSGEVKLSG